MTQIWESTTSRRRNRECGTGNRRVSSPSLTTQTTRGSKRISIAANRRPLSKMRLVRKGGTKLLKGTNRRMSFIILLRRRKSSNRNSSITRNKPITTGGCLDKSRSKRLRLKNSSRIRRQHINTFLIKNLRMYIVILSRQEIRCWDPTRVWPPWMSWKSRSKKRSFKSLQTN